MVWSVPLSNCDAGCSFLRFQIEPVQDFIRQARSARDLWTGSYLLNYLIAKAMFAVARPVGPESSVHPQLLGVPLVDWFAKPAGFRGDEKRPDFSKDRLTPNLPNRFLALVPQDWRDPQGRTIAQVAEQAVKDAWQEIEERVCKGICEQMGWTRVLPPANCRERLIFGRAGTRGMGDEKCSLIKSSIFITWSQPDKHCVG